MKASEDDLLLKTTSIEAGASLEALAKGYIKIPNKRKDGSICVQYYRKRRRINAESFNSPVLSFFYKCKKLQDHATLNQEAHVGDVMFSDRLANSFGSIATTDFVDKSTHGCHELIQNDYINGSMREDGSCKLTQDVCFLLTDNLMRFFDSGIEPNDDTYMHVKGDSYNSISGVVTEVEYATLPDSLLSFSEMDHIVCSLNTEDTVDHIPDSLLSFSEMDYIVCSLNTEDTFDDIPDSPLSFSEMDHIVCSLNTEDTVDDIPDSQLLDSPEHFLEDEDPSFNSDQQDVCDSEDDVESTLISHLDLVHLSEGKITCVLNTEDPEIPCNDSIFWLIHPFPCITPLTAINSINPASSFTQSQMNGPNLSSGCDYANLNASYTLKSESMDYNSSISDHNKSDSDNDLPCPPGIEDPEIPCNDNKFLLIHPSPSDRPQADTDSMDPASSFTEAHMDGLGLSSECDSANPHVGCTLNIVSMDHNPSISDHTNSDSGSDLPCFPCIENPETSPTYVRPQISTDSVDPASCFTRSQVDDADLSSEFVSENLHVGCTPMSVSMDHDPPISDLNGCSDLPCFPDIEDPATDSIGPGSCLTQSHMDGQGLSSQFDSVNPHVGCCYLKSVSMDHNPSISNDKNDSDLILTCFPDIEDPEIPSPSVRPQTATDSINPGSCLTQLQMDGQRLFSEFDSANPHVGCTLKSVSMDHNPSISNCFPDTEDPEISSASVRPQTATDSIDPTSSFTQSQTDSPSEFDSAHPHVGDPLKYVSADHNPSISDNYNSDSDGDLPSHPDIEALIHKLDLEYVQESWITNEAKRRKYQHCNRSISRLEQFLSRKAMSTLGAFAVLYSHRYNYYIKKTEVTIGRSTDDTEVDIDLRKESHSNMISRQQATIKMETDGTFTLENIGKGSILVNGESVAHGQVAALGSNCLIQIRGMDFNFEMNDRNVRWYLDNVMKKTQGFREPVRYGKEDSGACERRFLFVDQSSGQD